MSDETMYDEYYSRVHQLAFNGAATSYRLGRKGLIDGDPDTLAAREILNLQLRANDLYRNNPYAAIAEEKYVENLKALDITWSLPDKTPDDEMMEYWINFKDDCNLDGYGNFSTVQNLWNRGTFRHGKAFTRYQVRPTKDKYKVSLKLEAIPPEYHNVIYNGDKINSNTRYGITFEDTRPSIYHFNRSKVDAALLNPRAMGSNLNNLDIPAEELLHVFRRTQAGQWLGLPVITQAILALYEIEELTDAVMIKQKAAQAISWIVKNSNPQNMTPIGVPGKEKDKYHNDKIVFKSQAGNVQYLNKGEDVSFYQSTDLGSNLMTFMRAELQKIAAVCGVPYHQFTGDYSGINFSTLRGICVELRTRIEYTYHFYLIPLAILPVALKFRQFAALKNPALATSIPNFQLPRFYGVDELKDAQADVFEIQNGVGTLKRVLEERHLTYEEVEEDRKRIQALGLTTLLAPPSAGMAQTNNNSANSNSTGNG